MNVDKYLLPLGVTGYGPVMSMDMTSKGVVGISTSASGALNSGRPFVFDRGHIPVYTLLLTYAYSATSNVAKSSPASYLLPDGPQIQDHGFP